MDEHGLLRVWWIRNPPSQAQHIEVADVDEAIVVLEDLARADLEDDSIICNAGGLEIFEDGDWSEFCDESGRDIREIQDEREADEEE